MPKDSNIMGINKYGAKIVSTISPQTCVWYCFETSRIDKRVKAKLGNQNRNSSQIFDTTTRTWKTVYKIGAKIYNNRLKKDHQ